MKINEIRSLCTTYGETITLKEVLKIVQGNKIYKCPKCNGTGHITVNNNNYSWRTSPANMYRDEICDLCNGEGYTEHEYKPKMIQDGWE